MRVCEQLRKGNRRGFDEEEEEKKNEAPSQAAIQARLPQSFTWALSTNNLQYRFRIIFFLFRRAFFRTSMCDVVGEHSGTKGCGF